MAKKKTRNLGDVIDLLKQIPEDVFEGIRDRRPPQEREGLVKTFNVVDDGLKKELRRLAKRGPKDKLPIRRW